MKIKIWFGLWICGFVPMTACAGKSSDGGQRETPKETETEDFCTRVAGAGFSELRQELLQTISASSCPQNCPVENKEFRASPPRDSSLGERILLIDDAVELPAFTRYRSRTMANVHLQPSGRYEETNWTAAINPDALAILERVNAYERFIPMACLDMAMPFLEKFGAQLPQLAGHGMDILPSLADANPRAQFVVSEDQLSDILTQERLCPLLDGNETDWKKLEHALDAAQDSLANLIHTYAINYVHLSWGLEDKGLRERFKSCGAKQPSDATIARILNLYAELFQGITALRTPTERGEQPVYIFQAAPSAPYPLTSQDQQYALDCRKIPGRVRVNAASYHGFDVPGEGGAAPFALASHESNGQACTDFYVVTGYKGLFDPEAREQRIPSGPLGLGYLPSPSWPSASSFANPLGLSFFLYQRHRSPGTSHQEILQSLMSESTPKVFDPLLHQQLQIFDE